MGVIDGLKGYRIIACLGENDSKCIWNQLTTRGHDFHLILPFHMLWVVGLVLDLAECAVCNLGYTSFDHMVEVEGDGTIGDSFVAS